MEVSDTNIKLEVVNFDKLDQLYLIIDTLNTEQLDKVIKYCEEQKTVSNLIEIRRKNLAEILRVERIKWKKEMNNIRKQPNKKIIEESESSDFEEEMTEKKKPILKKKIKK